MIYCLLPTELPGAFALYSLLLQGVSPPFINPEFCQKRTLVAAGLKAPSSQTWGRLKTLEQRRGFRIPSKSLKEDKKFVNKEIKKPTEFHRRDDDLSNLCAVMMTWVSPKKFPCNLRLLVVSLQSYEYLDWSDRRLWRHFMLCLSDVMRLITPSLVPRHTVGFSSTGPTSMRLLRRCPALCSL